MPKTRRQVLKRTSDLVLTSGAAAAGALAFGPHAPAHAAAGPPLPQGARGKFVETNGVRLHYITAGTGPAVVLLHGWPQTSYAWHDTIRRLAPRHTVIAPDLRGLGLSEKTPSGYDKLTLAHDIKGLVDHAAGGRAHLVGHDMGGKVAYMFAHAFPESTSSLTMVECKAPGTENFDILNGGLWHYGFHMAADFPEMLTQGREHAYITGLIRAWSHRKDAVGPAAIAEYVRHYSAPGGMTAGFNYYRAFPRDREIATPLHQRRLDLPVLAIAGEHFLGVALASSLQPQAPNLTAAIAPGSGHFVVEEAPDFFHARLERFLAA